MRTRNHRVEVCLSDAEYQRFQNAVARAGVSQQGYLRHLIAGNRPKEKPPPDYFAMMNELRRVGDSLGRIADNIRSYGVFDPKEYDENVALYRTALREITHAVIGPEKGV